MRARGYARLCVSREECKGLLASERAVAGFLGGPQAVKQACVGKGGRKGDLMLWSCGYTAWPRV